MAVPRRRYGVQLKKGLCPGDAGPTTVARCSLSAALENAVRHVRWLGYEKPIGTGAGADRRGLLLPCCSVNRRGQEGGSPYDGVAGNR